LKNPLKHHLIILLPIVTNILISFNIFLNSDLGTKQDSLNLPANTTIDYLDANLAKMGGWALADTSAMYFNLKMSWGLIQFKMVGTEIYIRPHWGLSTPGAWKRIY